MLQIIALFDRRVKLELMFVVPIMRTLSLRRVLRYAREKMSERLDLLFEVPMIRASCERSVLRYVSEQESVKNWCIGKQMAEE